MTIAILIFTLVNSLIFLAVGVRIGRNKSPVPSAAEIKSFVTTPKDEPKPEPKPLPQEKF